MSKILTLLSVLAIGRFAQLWLLQHVLRRCCSVHRFLIALAAASFLCASPVMAIPAMDDLELRLQGEAKGWLNATCTYYGLGWLTADQGSKALNRYVAVGGALPRSRRNRASEIRCTVERSAMQNHLA